MDALVVPLIDTTDLQLIPPIRRAVPTFLGLLAQDIYPPRHSPTRRSSDSPPTRYYGPRDPSIQIR